MNIIFFGTPTFVIPVLQSLTQHFNVVGVITTPDKPSGRHQTLTPSPIKQFSLNHNIPVLSPEKLSTLQSDLFVVASYGKIIPQNILDLPKLGALNIHPSLLPQYRGASPIQYALLNGDLQTAISIIKMDAQMDHGPVLKTKTLKINTDDTFETLVTRAFQEASEILPQTIKEYTEGKIKPGEQHHNQATYTKIFTKQDSYVDLSQIDKMSSSQIEKFKTEIDRKIRAFYPWPTAWSKIKTKNGEKIIKLLPKGNIQMEGKKPTKLKDFINGYPETKEILKKILQ